MLVRASDPPDVSLDGRGLHHVLIRQKRTVLQQGSEADERCVHQAGGEYRGIGYLGGFEAFEDSRVVGIMMRKRRAPEVLSFEGPGLEPHHGLDRACQLVERSPRKS